MGLLSLDCTALSGELWEAEEEAAGDDTEDEVAGGLVMLTRPLTRLKRGSGHRVLPLLRRRLQKAACVGDGGSRVVWLG